MGLPQGTQQVLDVVAHFMGNHVGVGKVSVGPQLLPHAGEEGKVYVQFFIGRTVEGAHGGLSLPAGGAGAAGIEHQGGRPVTAQAVVCKIAAPNVFRRGQDLTGELGQRLVLRRRFILRGSCLGTGILHNHLEHVSQVSAHQEGKDGHYGNAAQAHTGGFSHRPAAVFHVCRFSSSVQFHNFRFFSMQI